MKVLIFTQDMSHYGSATYQYEFYTELARQRECILWGPGFKNFDPNTSLSQLISKHQPTSLFFAHSWLPDGSGIYNNNTLSELAAIDIPKFSFLNKEYARLEEKLNYFSQAKMTHIFSHHHNTQKYTSVTNIPCTFIPFAANEKYFSSTSCKSIDIFFSGLLKNRYIVPTNDLRERIQKNIFYTVAEFPLLKKRSFKGMNIVWKNYYTTSTAKILSKIFQRSERVANHEYYNMLCQSKSVINTFSPMNLIGTRYFESMASQAVVFCEKGNYHNIFTDMHNSIMFNNSLDDFYEKLVFSISDSIERKRIINNAYNDFISKHTWKHRVKTIIDIMEQNHG